MKTKGLLLLITGSALLLLAGCGDNSAQLEKVLNRSRAVRALPKKVNQHKRTAPLLLAQQKTLIQQRSRCL